MRLFILAGSAVLAVAAAPMSAQAQDTGAARPDATTAASAPQHDSDKDDTAKDAPPRGRISEEGGMKASGPSQGKGGESR